MNGKKRRKIDWNAQWFIVDYHEVAPKYCTFLSNDSLIALSSVELYLL